MDYVIRQARPEDADAIGGFTTDTFEWGDYITEVLPHWMAAENGCVMVAADENDQPVALGRGLMISGTELWLQGARVSEQWRRRGLASAIGESLVTWATERGARVARLLTEGWNEPAQRQVPPIGQLDRRTPGDRQRRAGCTYQWWPTSQSSSEARIGPLLRGSAGVGFLAIRTAGRSRPGPPRRRLALGAVDDRSPDPGR